MAKEENGVVRGTVGPAVFYMLNGKRVIRSKPRSKTKRTLKKNTKAWSAALNFGTASQKSKVLRMQSSMVLQGIDLRKTRYGFDKIIIDWLNRGKPDFATSPDNPSPFDGFNFNTEALLPQKLAVSVIIDWDQAGKVVVKIPEITSVADLLPASMNITSLQWIIQIASESMEPTNGEGDPTCSTFETLVTGKATGIPARTQQIPKRLKDGQLMVVILSLRYKFMDVTIADTKWMPVGIIGARYVAERRD